MNQLATTDLIVLFVYLAAMVGVGLWFGRRGLNSSEFMAAGRRVPSWAVGLSIFGTYVSSISFLALPGKAFASNWNAFVFSLSIPLTTWIAVKYFVPFYRQSGEVSAYQHLEHRFGPWARSYAVLCYLLTQLARMGTILYLLALALAPLTGFPITTIIIAAGLMVIVYTLIGGMEAVIWTDVMQSIVLIAGAVLCVAILLFRMPAGPGQLFEIASAHHKFSLGSFGPELSTMTFWVVLLNGIFINLQNFGIDQSYVQRYQTAKTDQAAARSVWLGALMYLPISAVFFFIGTGLFAFYAARPELISGSTDVINKPDAVFPHFIVTELPVGLTGLVIAAIFAAAQSTISSSINCSATLFLCDIYKRYFRPTAGERESMQALRGGTLAFGLGGIGMALAMMRIKNALDAWWGLASIFSGGMLGLFLLGRLSRRANSRAAGIGVLVGVAVIGWMTLSPGWSDLPVQYRNPMHPLLVVVVSTMAILLTGALAGRFTKPKRIQSVPETCNASK